MITITEWEQYLAAKAYCLGAMVLWLQYSRKLILLSVITITGERCSVTLLTVWVNHMWIEEKHCLFCWLLCPHACCKWTSLTSLFKFNNRFGLNIVLFEPKPKDINFSSLWRQSVPLRCQCPICRCVCVCRSLLLSHTTHSNLQITRDESYKQTDTK